MLSKSRMLQLMSGSGGTPEPQPSKMQLKQQLSCRLLTSSLKSTSHVVALMPTLHQSSLMQSMTFTPAGFTTQICMLLFCVHIGLSKVCVVDLKRFKSFQLWWDPISFCKNNLNANVNLNRNARFKSFSMWQDLISFGGCIMSTNAKLRDTKLNSEMMFEPTPKILPFVHAESI